MRKSAIFKSICGAHQELLESLGLPRDILDKIYYQNAQRLLGE